MTYTFSDPDNLDAFWASALMYLVPRLSEEDFASLVIRAHNDLAAVEAELPRKGGVPAQEVYDKMREKLADIALAYNKNLMEALIVYTMTAEMQHRYQELEEAVDESAVH